MSRSLETYTDSQFENTSLDLTSLTEVVCKYVEDVWPLSRSHTFSKEQAGQGQQQTHSGPPHKYPSDLRTNIYGVEAHGCLRILVSTREKSKA